MQKASQIKKEKAKVFKIGFWFWSRYMVVRGGKIVGTYTTHGNLIKVNFGGKI